MGREVLNQVFHQKNKKWNNILLAKQNSRRESCTKECKTAKRYYMYSLVHNKCTVLCCAEVGTLVTEGKTVKKVA